MDIVFFGTPTIAASILEYLLSKEINIIAIVTKPDKGQGRFQKKSFSPVKICAECYKIPVYQPIKARDPSFISILKNLKADLFVVVAYSEIFNEELLGIPPKGCINMHASLLPKYRGAAPIERCVMAAERESGVTIIKMVKELDAGDMYAIARTEVTEEMTSGDLYPIIAKIGGEALFKVIKKLELGTLSGIPQDHGQASYAPKLSSLEAEIDWNREAFELYNHIRGLTPKPGAWCMVDIQEKRHRLLIKKTSLESNLGGIPGNILDVEGLVIACSKGALRLLQVQLEGKNILDINTFLRGVSKNKLKFILKK